MTFQRLDVRSGAVTELIQHRKPEVVYHLAAQPSVIVSVEQPTLDAEVNILGSLNVIQGALAAGTRKIVFAGSGGTLYGVPESIPTREGHPQHPLSPYGVSKKAVLDYLHYYREIQGLEYTVLALANVYGPRQDPHGEAGVVAIFSGEAARRRATDDLRRRRADARLRLRRRRRATRSCAPASEAGGLTVNIGTGVETSVQQLFDSMARCDQLRRPGAVRAGANRRAATLRARPGPGRDPPGVEAVDGARSRCDADRRLVPSTRLTS